VKPDRLHACRGLSFDHSVARLHAVVTFDTRREKRDGGAGMGWGVVCRFGRTVLYLSERLVYRVSPEGVLGRK
jgi:hypothetical protein